MSAAEVVQRQLDAYKAHDLAAFVATYAEAAELVRVGSVDPPITGSLAASFAGTRSWITSVSSVSLLSHSRRLRSTR